MRDAVRCEGRQACRYRLGGNVSALPQELQRAYGRRHRVVDARAQRGGVVKHREMRIAHAYAVQQLRALGRELVAGSWSRAAAPMTTAEAAVTMSQAMVHVFKSGLVFVRDGLEDVTGDLVQPLA